MFMIADGRETFYQWDINQKLIVEDSTVKEVHFCNKTDDCSLVCEVRQEDGKRVVDVPNILLQTAWDIRAYAYTGEATKLEARYKVLARTKPTDYVYTETEVVKWEQLEQELIAEVEELKEELKQDTEQLKEDLISTVEEIVADNSANADNANALLGSKKGEVITIGDASPIKKDIAVKVASKNLIRYPYDDTTKEELGITYTDNGDGSITLNGTNTKPSIFWIRNKANATYTLNLIDGKTYTISGAGDRYGDVKIYVSYSDDTGATKYSTKSFVWGKDYEFGNIFVQIDIADTTFENYTIYPMIEESTTATAYTPYIEDISTVEVVVQGKNLLRYPYDDTTKTELGVTYVDNGDGSITVSGTPTGYTAFKLCTLPVNKSTTYAFTAYGEGENIVTSVDVRDEDGNSLDILGTALNKTFVLDMSKYPTGSAVKLDIKRSDNDVPMNGTVRLQFEVNTTATEYEPYKEPITYAVDAEGGANIEPIYPTTTLTATTGAIMQADYNRDINKAYQELYNAIISLGGNI